MDLAERLEALTSLEPIFDVSPEEVAWAAGFLEGEGWFAFSQAGYMRIGATQVNPEPLHRLMELFGGTCHFRDQDPKVRRGFWTWELGRRKRQEACRELTLLVLPWFSEGKRSKIPWVADE